MEVFHPADFFYASLLYLITLNYEQQIFIFLATGMNYLALFGAYRLGKYEKDQTAKGMNMAATSATVFFTYAGAYGLYLNFLVPLYALMLGYFLITLLTSYQYFSLVKEDAKKTALVYSFILGLSMMEVAWAINFWPFGYLTTGVIALILYYMLWSIVQSYFLNVLSQKRTMLSMLFFSFLILIVLLTSKWLPVI
jgi:phosphotransferase system  glucose/maltose/N-acetylglucosamine-specific IIC component